MILKSKTSCFTIAQIALTKVKDSFLESKTTCFTVSDGSDRQQKSVTWHNELIINILKRIVTDN